MVFALTAAAACCFFFLFASSSDDDADADVVVDDVVGPTHADDRVRLSDGVEPVCVDEAAVVVEDASDDVAGVVCTWVMS